ncbi:MAG: hypothetical protein AAGF59_07030, partial [Pseudomonadota bacterium]
GPPRTRRWLVLPALSGFFSPKALPNISPKIVFEEAALPPWRASSALRDFRPVSDRAVGPDAFLPP